MKKALIIYLSRKGTTKYFGHNIGEYLKSKNIEASVVSMHDAEPKLVKDFDFVLLGCWTHGLFVILQHPERQWVKFMKKLPEIKDKKIALFTTYKLATGSMFKKMEKPISNKINKIDLKLKAKGDELDSSHKGLLDAFLSKN